MMRKDKYVIKGKKMYIRLHPFYMLLRIVVYSFFQFTILLLIYHVYSNRNIFT